MPFSPFELLIVLFIVLLIFGAKRVPEMGRSLGSSLREFKDGITSFGADDEPERKALDRGVTPVETAADPRRSTRAV
jgi:sec-independent protein translocase protein TatA